MPEGVIQLGTVITMSYSNRIWVTISLRPCVEREKVIEERVGIEIEDNFITFNKIIDKSPVFKGFEVEK